MSSDLISGAVQSHLDKELASLMSLARGEDLEAKVRQIVERVECSYRREAVPTLELGEARVPLYVEENDAGRRSEPTEPMNRSLRRFEADVSRIKHSAAFRSLCGKKQIFPQSQGGTVRNRLSHSLEVADVAVRIARKINRNEPYFLDDNISLDVVYAAGLLHDIGHPPFGHTGEEALDAAVRLGVKDSKPIGREDTDVERLAFEGNAQTLRCVLRLEARLSSERGITDLDEARLQKVFGMNLCHRTILATLKYTEPITGERIEKRVKEETKSLKGYYEDDAAAIDACREACIKGYREDPERFAGMRTIECGIMDLADDIAYSTYDMEDCFASGLLHPLDLFEDTTAHAERILKDVNDEMHGNGYDCSLTMQDVNFVLADLFKRCVSLFEYDQDGLSQITPRSSGADAEPMDGVDIDIQRILTSVSTHQASKTIATFKELRRSLSEQLIESAVDAVIVDLNPRNPELSQVRLKTAKLLEVVVLKQVIYHLITMSPRLAVFDRRNRQIIYRVFEFLFDHSEVLPPDVRYLVNEHRKDTTRLRRIIADYIAGMTEYEIERLFSQTIGGVPQSNINGDVIR